MSAYEPKHHSLAMKAYILKLENGEPLKPKCVLKVSRILHFCLPPPSRSAYVIYECTFGKTLDKGSIRSSIGNSVTRKTSNP